MERYISVRGLEEAICKDVTISRVELNFTAILIDFFFKALDSCFYNLHGNANSQK